MTVWTVANQKGGVGKTTTAITLAGIAANLQDRVLLVDLDPHGSLSSYFSFDPDSPGKNLLDLFLAKEQEREKLLPYLIYNTGIRHIDVMPATTLLATSEIHLGQRPGSGLILKKALASLKQTYRHIFIDTAPLLSALLVNAIAAADHLIVPVQTEYLALKGLERMLKTLSLIEAIPFNQDQLTILPTMYDRRTQSARQCLKELTTQHQGKIWQHEIPVDTKFRDASMAGLPPSYFDRESRGVKYYRKLWHEYLLANMEITQLDESVVS